MAEALREVVGHNSLSRLAMVDWVGKHEDIERELAEVAETRRSLNRQRKDLRKNMAATGVDLDMFDRMRADLELTPEEREQRAIKFRQYWEWMSLPEGTQSEMDLAAGEARYDVHQLHAIDGEGYDAGLARARADTNPYPTGSEAHQRWLNAWTRGQEAAVHSQMGNGAAAEAVPKPRRGRPRKTANGHDTTANGQGNEQGATVTPISEARPEPEPPEAA
jgi:ribosome modulation factor